ncbi:TrbG/VirB9 family P-type conjugative transfer protein [Paraburkholderia sp. EG287B]|uniref:TrbG/VirB9 family P-type conjugative transfer protein n=1 Tax=Paraburkholderia sp. EG287B TaxID=3237010 RepID=UPI0034D302C3
MPILPPSFTSPQAYSPFAGLEINSVQIARNGASERMSSGMPSPIGAVGGAVASSAAYNFGWTVKGADPARPIQVFDDGSKIFVQFADMKQVPAIFAETSTDSRVLLRCDLQFPYAIISRSEQTLVFQMGVYEARAQRTPGNAARASSPSGGTLANQSAAPPNVISAPAVSKNTASVSSDALCMRFDRRRPGCP